MMIASKNIRPVSPAHFLRPIGPVNLSLRRRLKDTRCMYCLERNGCVGRSFAFVPASAGGVVGLLGFCSEHVKPMLDEFGKNRMIPGEIAVGRAAVPLIRFGARPPLRGPKFLRGIKCGFCENHPGITRQSDLFVAMNTSTDLDPLASRRPIYLLGFCFDHAAQLL